MTIRRTGNRWQAVVDGRTVASPQYGQSIRLLAPGLGRHSPTIGAVEANIRPFRALTMRFERDRCRKRAPLDARCLSLTDHHSPSLMAPGATSLQLVVSAMPPALGKRPRRSRPCIGYTIGRRRHSQAWHRRSRSKGHRSACRVYPRGVIAHPFVPQLWPSHALIWSSREPNPSCGTPMRMRTGKCLSASAIMKPLEAHRTDWRWLEG